MPKTFHLHLVSDATGETINSVMRACLVQFEDSDPRSPSIPGRWSARPARWTGRWPASSRIPASCSITIVNDRLREQLIDGCRAAQIQWSRCWSR